MAPKAPVEHIWVLYLAQQHHLQQPQPQQHPEGSSHHASVLSHQCLVIMRQCLVITRQCLVITRQCSHNASVCRSQGGGGRMQGDPMDPPWTPRTHACCNMP